MVVTTTPQSLGRDVSPPRPAKRKRRESSAREVVEKTEQKTDVIQQNPRRTTNSHANTTIPNPAQIEAGRVAIKDHLTYFSSNFSEIIESRRRTGQAAKSLTPLSIPRFSSLFSSQAGRVTGQHFVVHQHDHPVAGLHYDLRLQINEDSSVSWSVPYGLPGNPNERRRFGRRQCIETRVHAIWNHLVESASSKSGSTLIWDTGTYEVLPYGGSEKSTTDEDDDEAADAAMEGKGDSAAEKLCQTFSSGKIRIRLNGSKLPPGYTVKLSRTSQRTLRKMDPAKADRSLQGRDPNSTNPSLTPLTPKRKRVARSFKRGPQVDPSSDWDETEENIVSERSLSSIKHIETDTQAAAEIARNNDSDDEYEQEQEAIRRNNAYTGAHDTVGSVRGRWWIVYLDKAGCGLTKSKDGTGRVFWSTDDKELQQRYPFYVRGREVERSVVTGRKAADVLKDGGIADFVPRSGWNSVLD